MPKINDLLAAAQQAADESKEEVRPPIAFEFFPPRTADGVANLKKRLGRLAAQEPMYVDFTWGAGGTTSDLTLELALTAKKDYGLEPNMHLTCTNMPAEKIDAALEGALKGGIENIVALRGDPPAGEEKWEVSEGGFSCALDLVKHIRAKHGDKFCISVAGYPEGHPSAITKVEDGTELSDSEKLRMNVQDGQTYVCRDADYEKEIAYLKSKVDAGADLIITQMFFDVELYSAFVAKCRSVGITVPVVPGIMLLMNANGFKRMTGFCKTRVPEELTKRIAACDGDAEKVRALGVTLGHEMCTALLKAGAPVLHYYTLNLEKVVLGIMTSLGFAKDVPTAEAPATAAAAAAATPTAADAAAAPAAAADATATTTGAGATA